MKRFAYDGLCATALSLLFLACGGTAQSGSGGTGGSDTGGSGTASGGTGSGTGGASMESPSELEAEVCPAFTACGGDLSGDWKVVDVCITRSDIPVESSYCPTFKATWISTSLDGTASFEADGTLMSVGTAQVVERFDMPLSCLQTTCKEYEDALLESFSVPGALEGGTFEALECEEVADICICAMTFSTDVDSTQTYVIDGSTVTTTDEDGDEVSSYCVQGSRAVIAGEDAMTILERL